MGNAFTITEHLPVSAGLAPNPEVVKFAEMQLASLDQHGFTLPTEQWKLTVLSGGAIAVTSCVPPGLVDQLAVDIDCLPRDARAHRAADGIISTAIDIEVAQRVEPISGLTKLTKAVYENRGRYRGAMPIIRVNDAEPGSKEIPHEDTSGASPVGILQNTACGGTEIFSQYGLIRKSSKILNPGEDSILFFDGRYQHHRAITDKRTGRRSVVFGYAYPKK